VSKSSAESRIFFFKYQPGNRSREKQRPRERNSIESEIQKYTHQPPSECRLTIVSSSLARITRHRESKRERERGRGGI
jgi:hypothetical protein